MMWKAPDRNTTFGSTSHNPQYFTTGAPRHDGTVTRSLSLHSLQNRFPTAYGKATRHNSLDRASTVTRQDLNALRAGRAPEIRQRTPPKRISPVGRIPASQRLSLPTDFTMTHPAPRRVSVSPPKATPATRKVSGGYQRNPTPAEQTLSPTVVSPSVLSPTSSFASLASSLPSPVSKVSAHSVELPFTPRTPLDGESASPAQADRSSYSHVHLLRRTNSAKIQEDVVEVRIVSNPSAPVLRSKSQQLTENDKFGEVVVRIPSASSITVPSSAPAPAPEPVHAVPPAKGHAEAAAELAKRATSKLTRPTVTVPTAVNVAVVNMSGAASRADSSPPKRHELRPSAINVNPEPGQDTPKSLNSPAIAPIRLNSIVRTDEDQELPQPVACKLIERAGNRSFRAASVEMNGYRTSNEDAHVMLCTDKFGFFGVFDGHKGPHCSTFMAKAIPDAIMRQSPPLSTGLVQDIVLQADYEFRKTNPVGGSTAAMITTTLLDDSRIHVQISHVGDSRVIVGRRNGVVRYATKDHKPSTEQERLRIERHGGFVKDDRVDGKLAMSRALGDDEFKHGSNDLWDLKVIAVPSVAELVCTNDEFIVIACDGVFEALTNERVVTYVAEQLKNTRDTGKAVANLVDEALRLGSGDNITAILVEFKNGTGFASELEFVPGPIGSFYKDEYFEAYAASVKRAGLTVHKAVEMRFQKLCDQLASTVKGFINGTQQAPSIGDLMGEVKMLCEERLWKFADVCQAVETRLGTEEALTQNKKTLLVNYLTKSLREATIPPANVQKFQRMQQWQTPFPFTMPTSPMQYGMPQSQQYQWVMR